MSLLNLNVVKRFVSRFDTGIIPKIKGLTFNNNIEMKYKFEKLIDNRKIIQLYHCIRSGNYLEISENIFKNGFHIGPSSNKGRGVYFSSHSQYAVFWGQTNHIIVSDIIVDENYVSKHISEVYSNNNNWEYVISNTDLIFPRCLIEFETLLEKSSRNKHWSNGTCDNCKYRFENCEESYKRCDCKHFPVADNNDVINYNDIIDKL